MSLIQKKDADLLLDAGFSAEDLGLIEGGMQGVEIYETPENYFAHELIENAAEAGEINLFDDLIGPDEDYLKEKYDTTRKSIYADQEYDGGEDYYADSPSELRNQIEFLKSIKLGKMTVWQRKNAKGQFEWQVKNLKVSIPEEDMPRFNRLSKEYQKELWISYAKDEWKKAWEHTADSLKYHQIDEIIEFKTKTGYPLNLIVISADNVRKVGYTNMPPEARWVTLVFFYKDMKR